MSLQRYYDLVSIHDLHEICELTPGTLAKGSPAKDDHDAINEWPPLALLDIAQIQVVLYHTIMELSHRKLFAGALAIDWIDADKHSRHIARLDMKQEDCNYQDEEIDFNFIKSLVDEYFRHIESIYVAHNLGWLNVPPETALRDVHFDLQYASTKIDLSHGAFVVTIAISSMEDNDKAKAKFVADILEAVEKVLENF